jgi:hypothetical protein
MIVNKQFIVCTFSLTSSSFLELGKTFLEDVQGMSLLRKFHFLYTSAGFQPKRITVGVPHTYTIRWNLLSKGSKGFP